MKPGKKTDKNLSRLLRELDLDAENEANFHLKSSKLVISLLTGIFLAVSLFSVVLLEQNMIHAYRHNHTELITSNSQTCARLNGFFNIITTPLALLLTLFYMFLFWRRSCCLRCFLRRPAPPMIVHPFKKQDRFLSACVYGIMANEVMKIGLQAIFKTSSVDLITRHVNDSSGLFRLALRVAQVFLTAVCYYPPLVAFCANSFIVFATAGLYMILSQAMSIWFEGSCYNFEQSYEYVSGQIKALGSGLIASSFFKVTPHFFFMSLVSAVLCYKSAESFVFILGKSFFSSGQKIRFSKYKLLINEDLRFFSRPDITYSFNLVNKTIRMCRQEERNFSSDANLTTRDKLVRKLRLTLQAHVYKWDDDFRFSARVVSAHLVAFLALYYFMIDWVVTGVWVLRRLQDIMTDLLALMINFLLELLFKRRVDIEFGKIFIRETIITGYILAAVLTFIICCVQCLFGLSSIKSNLIKLYKGKHGSVPKLTSNISICGGNLRFTGYLVGFLLNGFVFINFFIFTIGILTYYLFLLGWLNWTRRLLLELVPVFVVLVVKRVFSFLCCKFLFLQKRAEFLALDNFRAYSIFVFIAFFFDCIIGAISAFIRLLVGVLGSLFFMPRIGYSFLGRQLEKFDGGFTTSTGYYQMEAAHSHPVMISFCALLYYKRLINKLDNFLEYDLVQLIKQDKIEEIDSMHRFREEKAYNRRVVNRWAVAVTLINNFNLISYRKKSSSMQKIVLC